MRLNVDWISFGFVALAFVSASMLTAGARVIARRTDMLDRPDGRRKAQPAPMPLLGGVAVYLALLVTVAIARTSGLWNWISTDASGRFLLTLLGSGGLFCAVGLWDDRVGLRPRTKLFWQVLASLPFVIWGRSVDSIHLFETQINLGVLGAVFTVFWLVACSNVINLVDGLDGLAGTIGVICCVAVAILSNMQGLHGPLGLSLICAAALCGFLVHNWPPARIYLGDSGSLMIGFMIGALAIESSMKTATGFALAIPLVLVSVPIFDTCMAIVRRKLNGRGIGEADRRHIHHCLQDRGLSRAQSLLVISALCLVMAAVTLVSAYFQNDRLALSLCLTLLALLIVGRVFGYDETILFFRYIRAMSTLLAGTSGFLKTQLVVDRMAHAGGGAGQRPIDYWIELIERVEAMGGSELEFVFRDEEAEEKSCHLVWSTDRRPRAQQPTWQFNYTLPAAKGVHATLQSQGTMNAPGRGQRLIDLFRLFDTFCRSWVDAPFPLATEEPSPATILSFPQAPAPAEDQPVTQLSSFVEPSFSESPGVTERQAA